MWRVIRVQDTRDFIAHCNEMNSPGQDCMELTYLYTKWWNCEEIWKESDPWQGIIEITRGGIPGS